MHDLGVVLARENISRPAHIGGKLVDLIARPTGDVSSKARATQVADREAVGRAGRELGLLQIGAGNPEALALQCSHQVRADETTGPAHQSRFHNSPKPNRMPTLGLSCYRNLYSFS